MGNNDPVAHSYKLPGVWAFVKVHVGIVRLAHNDTIWLFDVSGGNP